MKNRIMFAIAIAVSNLFNVCAWTSTETVDGITWSYTVEDGEATIGGDYSSAWTENPPTGDVVIPSTLGGYPVTAIGDSAFQFTATDSLEGMTSVTSVIIPEGVTRIGRQAFSDCSSLTNVVISSTVKNIEPHAFTGCKSLRSVVIPEGVVSIGFLAFMRCYGLEHIEIPASAEQIGGGFLALCTNLVSVTLAEENPNYTLEDGLLMSKDGQTVVQGFKEAMTIPYGVTSIEDWSFVGTYSLNSLTIPQSVTNVGTLAFALNSNLRSVAIPANVTSIGTAPFAYSTNIISFVVAEDNPNYKSLDGHLLSKDGKTFLSGVIVNGDVTIPDGVETIQSSAFEECDTLTSVTMPDSVKEIGDWAFKRCFNLRSVTFGNGVTNIGYSAFGSCRSLASITIPPSVTSIGYSAFSGCYSLLTVRVPMSLSSQTEIGSVFGSSGSNIKITYYYGAIELNYQNQTLQREKESLIYDGYLWDGENVVGLIQVKRPKRKQSNYMKDDTAITIQVLGEKKRTIKSKDLWMGAISDGEFDGTTKDGLNINLKFGVFGMWGSFENYQVVGARNIFDTKDKSIKSAAENMLAPWLGSLSLISDEGTLSVTVAKRGKVTVKGTFDGAKVSVMSQALICETDIRIPVIYSKKGIEMAFVVRLPFSGANPTIEGLDNAVIGKAGELTNGAKFRLDVDDATVAGVVPGALLEHLPNGEGVTAAGKKWVVAGGAKAAKVKYDKKTGLISVQPAKKGGEVANVANLKLKYTSKDGSFNGSFKIYSVENKKLKTYTFKVSGVLIDGVGYGVATCRNPNVTWNITIE